MPFSTKTREIGDLAGPEHGLDRLILLVQPVAPHEVANLHRHDRAEQVLRVLEGEVFIEVDGEARICRPGEMGVVPAGATHGFHGLGAPGLLEVFGEQHAGTVFLLAGGDELEVHRPGVPWDRPGPATDMAALASRLVPPSWP
jgi:quercetin dioxygenase-like cupin family protein